MFFDVMRETSRPHINAVRQFYAAKKFLRASEAAPTVTRIGPWNRARFKIAYHGRADVRVPILVEKRCRIGPTRLAPRVPIAHEYEFHPLVSLRNLTRVCSCVYLARYRYIYAQIRHFQVLDRVLSTDEQWNPVPNALVKPGRSTARGKPFTEELTRNGAVEGLYKRCLNKCVEWHRNGVNPSRLRLELGNCRLVSSRIDFRIIECDLATKLIDGEGKEPRAN